MKTIGQSMNLPVRVAASATRGYVGEPMMVAPTYSSGVASVNTAVVVTDDKPVIGTDRYLGLLHEDMDVNSSGTVTAHRNTIECPYPNLTRTRGRVTTASTADTESEAIGLLFDIYVFDLISSTYTWKPAAADTGAFEARWYNIVTSELDCVVDTRGVSRVDIS